MIKSMTGYGRAREVLNKRDITVEVRSVNNRYLDCTVKMPRMYAFAEDVVKQHVQKAISRGKVDVFITVDASAADVAKVTVNRELAAQYAAALGELAEVCGTEPHVTPEQLSRFPDVLTVTKADEDLETVSADLCAVLDEALAAYKTMRAVEGAKLAEDIGNRLTYIENYTSQVEERSPQTVAEYRAKLTARMQEAAEALDFERAARYRDRISAIRRITEQQKVIAFPHESLDVVGSVQGEEKIYLSLLVLREGRLRDKKDFSFDCMGEPEEVITEFLLSYYLSAEQAPAEVFLDRDLPDLPLLQQLLREHRGKKLQFTVPQRGESRKLCEMAQNNAAQELARDSNRTGREIAALTELARLLGLPHPPEHIEAFDISNIGGQTIVGGMTVFRRGRPEKRLYKKFTIRGQSAPDDYAAMEQMLTRRLTHYREAAENGKKDGFEILPDLWLIDGGAGQAAVARRVTEQFGLSIPVFGMVKDDRHRTRAIRAESEEIAIRSNKAAFQLITAIQDETHRYAITFSRKKHGRAGVGSALTQVPGIGPQRASGLLRHFKSMAAVRAAGVEELAAAPGMTRPAAETLYRCLHGEPTAEE